MGLETEIKEKAVLFENRHDGVFWTVNNAFGKEAFIRALIQDLILDNKFLLSVANEGIRELRLLVTIASLDLDHAMFLA